LSKRAVSAIIGGHEPLIGANVQIGHDVVFGRGVIVYDNVEIDDDTVLGPNVIVGEPLVESYGTDSYRNPFTKVGRESVIRAGSVIYAGCTLGSRLTTGHYAFIRERTVCGDDCSFGTFCSCDGDVTIGDRSRFHYSTFIGKMSQIGDDVWMFPHSQLYDDPHPPCGLCLRGPSLKNRVVVGAGALILPGICIGEDAVVAAGSVVTRDVPPGMLAIGSPAVIRGEAKHIKCRTGAIENPYPWTTHFSRLR
jgi:acetyltransferase-like isoleucine patch superfamily enzyme